MNYIVPPIGKVVTYQIPGGYTGKLEPSSSYTDAVRFGVKGRYWLKLHSASDIQLSWRDPNSDGFSANEWVNVGTDFEAYVSAPLWIQAGGDVHVIEGQ